MKALIKLFARKMKHRIVIEVCRVTLFALVDYFLLSSFLLFQCPEAYVLRPIHQLLLNDEFYVCE